ncbi:MAG: hypothetical protein RR444_10575 [Oscillospiraceae bacterium]
MKNNTMSSVVKGLAAGAVIGTATYMMTTGKKKNNHNVKKNAGKALKAVGTVIENVSYMMK